MHIKLNNLRSSEARKDISRYPNPYDNGFEYYDSKSPRFNVQAVKEHCEILLTYFSKGLENVAKRAPLTYDRALATNRDSSLILRAAERSERRLLAHVVRYTESKYALYIELQQKRFESITKGGRNSETLKKAMDTIPVPTIDLAIFQYCHMLSSGNYQDDILRLCNRLYGEGSHTFVMSAPLLDLPMPLRRLLDSFSAKPAYKNKNLKKVKDDLEKLNGKEPSPDYLHWPEGEPLYDFNCLLDEVPERMMCVRCDRDIYFTKDKGEAWSSFIQGESVLCRHCGASNSSSMLQWRVFRDDLLMHRKAILFYKDHKAGHVRYPDMFGRQMNGPGLGKKSIDRLLQLSIPEASWDRITKVLAQRSGSDDDWEELIKEFSIFEGSSAVLDVDNDAITTISNNFWMQVIQKYRKAFNRWISVDFETSITNLLNFVEDINRLSELTNNGPRESEKTSKRISKFLGKFSGNPGDYNELQPLPKGSGMYYEQFMKLKAKHPTKELLPTITIELVWRTHLLYPSYYHRWCLQTCGCWIEHKFDDVKSNPLEKLKAMYWETSDLWWKEYSEEYVKDSQNWDQYFSQTRPYANGIIHDSRRNALKEVKGQQEILKGLGGQSSSSIDQSSNLGFPSPQSLDLIAKEQEELYHTIFDSLFTRQLVTAKLLLQNLEVRDKTEIVVQVETKGNCSKKAPLEAHLKAFWDHEKHDEIIHLITKYPVLNKRMSKQIDQVIIAIDLLFSFDENDITQEMLFQPRHMDDGKNILSKRLLLWLCTRNHKWLRSKFKIPEFFKKLHNARVLVYRIDISPCDVTSARAITFIEQHYAEVVQRVVKKCEPLLKEFVPRDKEYAVPISPIRAQAELNNGMQDFESTGKSSETSKGKEKAKTSKPPKPTISPATAGWGWAQSMPKSTLAARFENIPPPVVNDYQSDRGDGGDGDGGDRGDGGYGDGGYDGGGWDG